MDYQKLLEYAERSKLRLNAEDGNDRANLEMLGILPSETSSSGK